jgi:hypothetical protein
VTRPATAIDTAHAALEAAPGDAGRRMAFYGQVAAAELFVPLEAEPEGETVRPVVLEVEGTGHVLAFDTPERLAAFLDAPQPYAALAGRAVAAMLAGRGLALLLNAGAPSESVLPPAALDWLSGTAAAAAPAARAGRIAALAPPDPPPALVEALATRLGAWAGLVETAHLAAARFEDGGTGLVLALVGAPDAAETAIAAAIDEALRFSGVEGLRLELLFATPGAAAAARIARAGLTFRPEPPAPRADAPPLPPRLR